MDWIRLGLSYRAVRIRRRWRQIDLSRRADVSRSLVSKIERGLGGEVSGAILVRVATALDARLEFGLRWHGEGLDRLLDSAHAHLVERVVDLLTANGWEVAVEVSFAISGERGSIDVFARHRATGILLLVEVKSVVPDNQAMHGLDRKVRLAPRIARERGWEPVGPIARLLVIAEGTLAPPHRRSRGDVCDRASGSRTRRPRVASRAGRLDGRASLPAIRHRSEH